MDAPFVVQCAGCRRVLSDSNQLVCAVETLDVLVFDAVVGVRIDAERGGGDTVSATLSCTECQAQLGHRYSHVPAALAAVASTPAAPRYAMQRHALASYVFGSAKTQHDAILGWETPAEAHEGLDGAPTVLAPVHPTSTASEMGYAVVPQSAASATASSSEWSHAEVPDSVQQSRIQGLLDSARGEIRADIAEVCGGVRDEVREGQRDLAERMAVLEEALRRAPPARGGEGAPSAPHKDEGARERISQLTRALLSLDGRVEAMEEAERERREAGAEEAPRGGVACAGEEPAAGEYSNGSDAKRARSLTSPQYV